MRAAAEAARGAVRGPAEARLTAANAWRNLARSLATVACGNRAGAPAVGSVAAVRARSRVCRPTKGDRLRPLHWLVAIAALLSAIPLAAQDQGEPKRRIALVPVVVHSAEDPDYLRAGLADMLVARLEQAGVFTVVRIQDPSQATSELEAALEVGRNVDAEFVLFGSFTRFGQGASLDMQAASTADAADAEPLREIFVHSGSIGDVIPDLDELVGKVSRFAVADYEGATPAAGGNERARPSVDKLRRRIETLERDTRDLRRNVDDLQKALQQAQRPDDG